MNLWARIKGIDIIESMRSPTIFTFAFRSRPNMLRHMSLAFWEEIGI